MQRDQDQEDGKAEVIVEPKTASPPEPFAGKDHFCQDSFLQIYLALLAPFPHNIWEEDQGLYK